MSCSRGDLHDYLIIHSEMPCSMRGRDLSRGAFAKHGLSKGRQSHNPQMTAHQLPTGVCRSIGLVGEPPSHRKA